MLTENPSNGFAYARSHNILSVKRPVDPGGKWIVYEYGVAKWDNGDNTEMRKKHLGSFTSYKEAKLNYPGAHSDFKVSDIPLFRNLRVT